MCACNNSNFNEIVKASALFKLKRKVSKKKTVYRDVAIETACETMTNFGNFVLFGTILILMVCKIEL